MINGSYLCTFTRKEDCHDQPVYHVNQDNRCDTMQSMKYFLPLTSKTNEPPLIKAKLTHTERNN